jgi:hypothetical protein
VESVGRRGSHPSCLAACPAFLPRPLPASAPFSWRGSPRARGLHRRSHTVRKICMPTVAINRWFVSTAVRVRSVLTQVPRGQSGQLASLARSELRSALNIKASKEHNELAKSTRAYECRQMTTHLRLRHALQVDRSSSGSVDVSTLLRPRSPGWSWTRDPCVFRSTVIWNAFRSLSHFQFALAGVRELTKGL